MDHKYYSIVEMAFSGTIILGFAIWQLVSINREIARDKARQPPETPSPEGPGHPVGEHRLDDR
jgi:hypothetical protein